MRIMDYINHKEALCGDINCDCCLESQRLRVEMLQVELEGGTSELTEGCGCGSGGLTVHGRGPRWKRVRTAKCSEHRFHCERSTQVD